MKSYVDLKAAMEELSRVRPVFHSEAAFQHAYRPAYRAGEWPELMARPRTAAIDELRQQARSKDLALAR